MKIAKTESFFLLTAFLIGLLFPSQGGSETLIKVDEKSGSNPLMIKSKSLEVDNDLKMLTFTGDVHAKRHDFAIDCQEMFVYYDRLPTQKDSKEGETKINKIVATGDVKINRTHGGVATAEKAVYYQRDEKVILMGKPVVKQGNDFVEGDRITVFLKENRSVVESSEDQKVRAFVFPKSEER
jgi:lipopolysaccharide export system protein LptA